MADFTDARFPNGGGPIKIRYQDMGDGTHAEVVSLSGGSAVTPPGGGSATLPYTYEIADDDPHVIGTDGLRNRQLDLTVGADATLTHWQQFYENGPWRFATTVTASDPDADKVLSIGGLRGNIYAVKIERTVGTDACTAVLA